MSARASPIPDIPDRTNPENGNFDQQEPVVNQMKDNIDHSFEEEKKYSSRRNDDGHRDRSDSSRSPAAERRRVSSRDRSRDGKRVRGSRSPDNDVRRRSPHDKGDSSFTQIYVTGFPKGVTERDLEKFFERHGETREIVLKGKYGFIDFRTAESA